MKTLLKVGIIISLSVLTASFTFAGVNQWTTNGPSGRSVFALAVDPKTLTILYAGTDVGVFKSTDRGASWAATNTGLPPAFCSNETYPVALIVRLAINPIHPTVLYVVTEECTQQRIFVSVNGGGSWSDTGFRRSEIDALVIDPKNPAILYTGTGDGEVFKSVDGGGHWSRVFQVSPLTPPALSAVTLTLAIDPVTPTTVYAGYYYVTSVGIGSSLAGALAKSADGGVNWTTIGVDPVQAIAVDPVTPDTLYVAWQPTRITASTALAGGGVAKSPDGGASWTVLNFPTTSARALMIDPTTPTTLYAATNFYDQGVSRSTDGGQRWYFINNGLPDSSWVTSLAVDPMTGTTLYAGIASSGGPTPGGVFDIQVAGLAPTEIVANFESPEAGQAVAGIAVVRGWAFVPQQQADIKNVYVSISNRGINSGVFFAPCCSERRDVLAAYPQFPANHTLNSGWGVTFNWGNLPAGDHELRVEIENTAGERVFLPPRLVAVVKAGDFEFLDQFGLSAARASITGDQVALSGVLVREKSTHQQKQINTRFQWFTDTQSLGLVESETVSPFSSQQSAVSWLLATVSVNLQSGLGFASTVEAAGGITGYIESPADNQAASGISILRGWAFAEDVGVPIQSVGLALDGEAIGTVFCCSSRDDVSAAFPDNPNALLSGWGMQYNFGVLPPGAHTLTAKFTAANSVTQTLSRPFFSVRIGGFSFIDQFDLAGATARIDGEEIVLSDVQVRDKASQQTKVIEVRLRWFQHSQSLGVVASSS